MRNPLRRGEERLLLAAFLFLLSFAAGGSLAAETGVVEEVVDGDTIRVQVGGATATVRLIGIDAPERSHPSLGKEYFGDEAAAYLSSLCLGKTVRMEQGEEETDRYDRLLRYVFLVPPDGRLLNIEMIRAGMARAPGHSKAYTPAGGKLTGDGGAGRHEGPGRVGQCRQEGGALEGGTEPVDGRMAARGEEW